MIDREFRLDCGATWLNLLATRGRSYSSAPVERIATPTLLGEWLLLSGLPPEVAPTAADLELAWQLRADLRALAMAAVAGTPPPAGEVARLAAFVEGPAESVLLDATDRLVRRPPHDSTTALRRIALQAVDQLTGDAVQALAVCPEHDCRGVFANPGGRRRWCPAPACASRGRVRALRERRARA